MKKEGQVPVDQRDFGEFSVGLMLEKLENDEKVINAYINDALGEKENSEQINYLMDVVELTPGKDETASKLSQLILFGVLEPEVKERVWNYIEKSGGPKTALCLTSILCKKSADDTDKNNAWRIIDKENDINVLDGVARIIGRDSARLEDKQKAWNKFESVKGDVAAGCLAEKLFGVGGGERKKILSYIERNAGFKTVDILKNLINQDIFEDGELEKIDKICKRVLGEERFSFLTSGEDWQRQEGEQISFGELAFLVQN